MLTILHRIILLFALLAAGVFPLSRAQAQNSYVQWGLSGTSAAAGILNAALIPTNTGTNPVRYSNVNGQGYDIVVVTKSLTQSGAGTMPWNGIPAWWFEANTPSRSGQSIPYSTIEVHFYQQGTNTPFGVSGENFTFQNAKDGERYRDFNYWDYAGNEVPVSFLDGFVFSYASGAPIVHQSDNSIESGIPYVPGNSAGDWIGVDLSPYVISGFTFQTGRESSSYGSNFMTALGNVQPTGQLVIDLGTDDNVTAGPAFVTTGSSAQLTPNDIEVANGNYSTSITTGSSISQGILINQDIDSSSGYPLSMQASQSIIFNSAAIALSSTYFDPGNLCLVSQNASVLTDHIEVSAFGSASISGNISITAPNNIYVTGGLDTSALTSDSQGGDITLTAGNIVSVDSLQLGGGGASESDGAPGNLVISASNSVDIGDIYNDSGLIYSPTATITAPTIAIGFDIANPPDISGTLYLEHPAASSASISLSGSINGTGSIVIDSGTGSATLYSEADYNGETDILSGSFYAQGNPLSESDVHLENNSTFFPGIAFYGQIVSVNSLTVDTNATLDINLTSTAMDNVQAAGAANLAGILNVTFEGGFAPGIGRSLDILDYTSLSGQFGTYQGLRLSDRVLTPVYTGTNLLLVSSTIPTGASQPLQSVPPSGLAVNAGGYYNGLTTSLETADGFTASGTIIDGTASQATTVNMALAASGTANFELQGSLGAYLLSILGTGSDKYVVQLDYKEAAVLAAAGDERQLFLDSSNGSSPFANAVLANTNLPGEANNPTQCFGAYNPATDFHLGYYGVDTVDDRVWAVVDYPAYFGVGAFDVTTTPAGPAAATVPATNILVASATLNGLVNYNGFPTAVMFETGTDPGLAGAALSGTVAAGSGFGISAISYSSAPLMPGATYYFRIDSIANPGTQYGGILSFQTPLGAINYWRQTYFGTYYNSGQAADNANPTGDGIPNLLKYATGLSPTAATGTQPVTSGVTSFGGHTYLTFTFNEIADPILIYSVQAASSSAGPWTTIWSSTGASNAAGPVTVRDTSPIGAASSRFLRLQITY